MIKDDIKKDSEMEQKKANFIQHPVAGCCEDR
jgi:hypothetical protein